MLFMMTLSVTVLNMQSGAVFFKLIKFKKIKCVSMATVQLSPIQTITIYFPFIGLLIL